MDDGLFEVTLIRMPKNPIELNEIIASLTNLIDNTDSIYTFKTGSLQIKNSSSMVCPSQVTCRW